MYKYLLEYLFSVLVSIYLGLELKDAFWGFPGGAVVKNLPAMQETWERQAQSSVGKIPWRSKWLPTLAFLLGKSHA